MNILKGLLDNRFWYIGTSYSDLGDNSLCVLIRNPLDDLRGKNDQARAERNKKNKQQGW